MSQSGTSIPLLGQGPSIRILEKDNNRRGDLFGRLMADLFVALGYEQPRLNIHKSGRELDLSADHRLEPRRAIGERKATAEAIGGDDLNKFVGALDAEQEDKQPLVGYFISLSGFKETAIEQERQRLRTKIIMLDGTEVVGELVRGRILISKERATDLAGRCCATLNQLVLDPQIELLAHDRGWIWAVYYTQGKTRTHFVLIHSDGTPLAQAIASEVIAADTACGGVLHSLSCLNPEPTAGADSDPRVTDALAAYREYLVSECGFIQLDGLPADTDVGSRRLRLEHLFVPLHLDIGSQGKDKKERQPVGSVIAEHPRLALLAPPGGGKSTLIKRLAVAYADSSRRGQIADDLPERNWFPLFFRCRELRGLARGSFAELLDALAQREPVRQHADLFRSYVDRALLAGRVLLLVDGLDEISDPGDRAAFVCTLRTALLAYPKIALIVTSREAGFRHVAAHLAPICTHAALSSFDGNDIKRLSVTWHQEVVGDTDKVRADAEQLAATIAGNNRIYHLAKNPLLLTTLLLVRRWVGSLPIRRAVLYGKAVELLLMTWNTDGHEPIPEEEALPQLCYVASSMMVRGVQKISRPKLAALLQEARIALPTELGYVKGTVDEFIHRVEDRSSLLMMTGHDVEQGRLVEFFEFRHLTFQEFLTARGMVEGWQPGRTENDNLASVLEPHFNKEEWQEVIPLAAVLGGKATEALIQRLTMAVSSLGKEKMYASRLMITALVNCLADEAAARPDTVRAALHQVARVGGSLDVGFTAAIARGRYGADLYKEARSAFLGLPPIHEAMWVLCDVISHGTVDLRNTDKIRKRMVDLEQRVNGPDRITRVEGALGIGDLLFYLREAKIEASPFAEVLGRIGAALSRMTFSEDSSEQCAAIWALVWVGASRLWSPPNPAPLLERLFTLWRDGTGEVARLAIWSFNSQRLVDRAGKHPFRSMAVADIPTSVWKIGEFEDVDPDKECAALVIGWYLRILSNGDLRNRAKALREGSGVHDTVTPMLNELLARLDE